MAFYADLKFHLLVIQWIRKRNLVFRIGAGRRVVGLRGMGIKKEVILFINLEGFIRWSPFLSKPYTPLCYE
jgi:hypothetical protein